MKKRHKKQSDPENSLPQGAPPADNQEKKSKDDDNYMALGMCVGLCLGLSLGEALFGNMTTGMCIGMCLGLVVGVSIKKKKPDEPAE